jgi:predicted Na+-dependent transporter
MQNSGLGAALAREHFQHLPVAPLPCAISATFHSVIGSILAGLWRMRLPPNKGTQLRTMEAPMAREPLRSVAPSRGPEQ